MWMVWTLLTLVVFCLVLSMIEEPPAAFRRRDARLPRRSDGRTLGNCHQHSPALVIAPVGDRAGGAAFSRD